MSEKGKKLDNNFHIGFKTKPSSIVAICQKLFKENTYKDIHLSAVGGSIGNLVTIVEVLKAICPGLYQQNKISTVTYQSVDENTEKVEPINSKLFPKFEVTLSLEKPTEENEGFQDKLTEEERKNILDAQAKIKEAKKEKKRAKSKRIGGKFKQKFIRNRKYSIRGKSAINRRRTFSKKYNEKNFGRVRRGISLRVRYRSNQKKLESDMTNKKPFGINSNEGGRKNSSLRKRSVNRKYSGGFVKNSFNQKNNNGGRKVGNEKRSPFRRISGNLRRQDNSKSNGVRRWGNGRRNNNFKKGNEVQRS